MHKLRKIFLVFARSTSHVMRVLRYEVPLRREASRHGAHAPEVRIQPIPKDLVQPEDVVTLRSAESAYQSLLQSYGTELVSKVYPSFESFKSNFDATVRRDDDAQGSELAPATDSWQKLMEIDGIGDDLAKRLFEAKFTSIFEVANAELNDLEAVDGIGPATAEEIREDARRVVSEALAKEAEQQADTDPLESTEPKVSDGDEPATVNMGGDDDDLVPPPDDEDI